MKLPSPLLEIPQGTVDCDRISDKDYRTAMEIGVAELIKQGVLTYKDIAYSGRPLIRRTGKVMTEAKRIARNLVKEEIRRQGGKLSSYLTKDITQASLNLLKTDQGKEIIAQAEANLKDAKSMPASHASSA